MPGPPSNPSNPSNPPSVPPPPPPPAQPGGPKAAPPKSRGWRAPIILLPLAVSALSLMLAFVSLLVAWRAVSVANDTKDTVAGGQPADTAATADSPAEKPEAPASSAEVPRADQSPPDPNATGVPPELDERTNYEVEYEKDSLTLVANQEAPMYLDVDEPRAEQDRAGAELALTRDYNNNWFLELAEGADGAMGEPGMTPNDCSDQIRKAPLGGDRKVAPVQGNVLCLLTSFAAAQTKGDEWRLARLEITGIGADGRVTVEVTAWNIPR